MKKLTLLVLFALLACLAFPADPLKKEFKKTYATINSLFVHQNIDAFERMLASDYVYVGSDHKQLNRVEFIKSECDPIRAAKKVGSKVRVLSIVKAGEDVKVGYDWHLTMWDANGKTVAREVGVDTWRKMDGKWMNTRTEVSSSTAKTTPIKVRRVRHKKP